MAQHISWSQGHFTSLLISESILQTSILVWTVPDIYEYLLLWDILYIIRNCLMSTFQHKFNCANWSTSCGNISWMKFVILRMHFLIFLKLPLFLCMRLVFFLFINLLHSAWLQFIADYLEQVAYSFGLKLSS